MSTPTYGVSYAYNAFGGFKVEQGFPLYRPTNDGFRPYNLEDAIQVKYSVRDLNYKVGVVLNHLEAVPAQVSYHDNGQTYTDQGTNLLIDDVLDITNDEFIYGMNTTRIVSMGKMATLYTDFLNTINAYFGSPIILNNNIFTINNGVFDASAFIHLINGGNFNINGSYVTDFSGSIHVYDVNSKIRSALKRNLFNNRIDGNHTIKDGFVAGDVIYVPDGITVTLKLDIDHGANIDIYSGVANLKKIDDQLNYYDSVSRVRKTTLYSNTNITQTYTVPLVLIASNEETYNFDNYGLRWYNRTSAIGPRNWNFVGVSATGQYQSAIDLSGHIYVSQDFGGDWIKRYDISYSDINTINITHDGQYQTASNGNSIYVSSNYGTTWKKAFDTTGTLIYLCISLNGQYQKVVSSGDSIYSSNDYGVTWNRLDDSSDLFYSIQAFPTAGISMSYDGRYQAIASESIYITSDYGGTWTDAFENSVFHDGNWIDISIASDGSIMVAVDSGGKVYKSSDYGVNWTVITDAMLNIDSLWRNVSISGTGKYMSLLQDNGFIYYSVDFGVTWAKNTDPALVNRQWRCVSVSTNGHYQAAVEFNGYIYVSNLL